jgi:hypothetical protein
MRSLERFLEALAARGCVAVVTCDGTRIDLNTAAGREWIVALALQIDLEGRRAEERAIREYLVTPS